MNVDQWAANNIGRGVEGNPTNPYPPNSIYGQCVTAASSWSMEQGLGQLLGETAWDIWLAGAAGYDRISPSVIQGGDIVFYQQDYAPLGIGSAGHVNVCVSLINGGYRGVDMDWNNTPSLQYNNHGFPGVVGAFRKAEQGGEIMDGNVVTSMFRMGFRRNPTGQELTAWTGQNVGVLLNAELTNPEWLQGAGPAGVSQNVVDSLVRGILGINPTTADYTKYVGQSLNFVLSDVISRKGSGNATVLKSGLYQVQ